MKTRYEVETAYTYANYADFFKTLARKKHHFFLKHGIVEAIILAGAALAYFKWEYKDIALMFALTLVIYPYAVSTMQKLSIRKQWRRLERKWSKKVKMVFFDDYFDQTVDGKTSSFGYYELKEVLESKTRFHLLVNDRNAMSIEKAACSEGLQQFLRNLNLQEEE